MTDTTEWAGAKVIKANGTFLIWDCIAEVYRSEDGSTYPIKTIKDAWMADARMHIEVIAK